MRHILKQGLAFPTEVKFCVLQTQKFAQYKRAENAHVNITNILEAYDSKVIILYQFPRPQFLGSDPDPIQQLNFLKQKFNKEPIVFLGVSHQHPFMLKQLQAVINENTKDS